MDNQNKQEEKIGTFFDIIEKKKNNSFKKRRIISRIIRLIISLIFPFIYAVIANIVAYLVPSLLDDFGIVINVLCILILVPIYCIIYGISVVRNEKRKYLFALYNPIVSCWFLFLDWSWSFAFFSYGWLLFWTLVPIWKYNYDHNPENHGEQSNEA